MFCLSSVIQVALIHSLAESHDLETHQRQNLHLNCQTEQSRAGQTRSDQTRRITAAMLSFPQLLYFGSLKLGGRRDAGARQLAQSERLLPYDSRHFNKSRAHNFIM